jgi:hypothetical protein
VLRCFALWQGVCDDRTFLSGSVLPWNWGRGLWQFDWRRRAVGVRHDVQKKKAMTAGGGHSVSVCPKKLAFPCKRVSFEPDCKTNPLLEQPRMERGLLCVQPI